jgi:hypothetical protein
VLTINPINHFYVGFDEFSPLINISKFKGELPQNEKIIREVSRYIKTHENGSSKIENMYLGSDYAEFEEKMRKLLTGSTSVFDSDNGSSSLPTGTTKNYERNDYYEQKISKYTKNMERR